MPIYNYKCDHCGHVETDVYEKMNSDNDTTGHCPACCDGRKDDGSWHRMPTVPHTNLREFHKPIEMYSIGLNDDEEIRAFKQKCPDVDVCTDPASDLYGVPIARNRAQKASALNAAGFQEK